MQKLFLNKTCSKNTESVKCLSMKKAYHNKVCITREQLSYDIVVMIGLLHREALDRLRVHLNTYNLHVFVSFINL